MTEPDGDYVARLDAFLASLQKDPPLPGWSNPDPWHQQSHWIPEHSRALCGISYYSGDRHQEPPQGAPKCQDCEAAVAGSAPVCPLCHGTGVIISPGCDCGTGWKLEEHDPLCSTEQCPSKCPMTGAKAEALAVWRKHWPPAEPGRQVIL